ncbi:MAG: hypothetical protein PVJ09_00235 [Candidatus Woesebacteria bacterium]|jgi:hypothetical protein
MKKKAKQYYQKFKKMSFNQKLSIFAGLFTICLFIFLAISSVLLQKNLQTSQDIRKAAWNQEGAVSISTYPVSGYQFLSEENNSLDIQVNTHGAAIDGVQLQFLVQGDLGDYQGQIFPNGLNFQSAPNSGLTIVQQIINPAQCRDCYTVQLMIISNDPNIPFISTDYRTIARLEFNPQTSGNAQFDFLFSEGIHSYALRHGDVSDELVMPDDWSYYVVDQLECTDSDGGRNYEVLGTVTGNGANSFENSCPSGNCTDFCFNDWNTLNPVDQGANINEWFCLDGERISYDRRICEHGCSNGVCLPEQPATPIPTEPTLASCVAPSNFYLYSNSITCSGDGQTMNFAVNWPATANASEYLVQAINADNPNDVINNRVTEPVVYFNNVLDGTWYLRVAVSAADACTPDLSNWTYLDFTYDCQNQQYCQYDRNAISECIDGYQQFRYTLTANSSDTCSPASYEQSEPCMPQCQYDLYSCSDWSECYNNIRSRTCTENQADNCWWYESAARPHEWEYCQTNTDFFLYNYESCWYADSAGESLYIIWDRNRYPDVDWINISPYLDFREFAHKNVVNDTYSYYEYLVTQGSGFYWNNADQNAFYFSPDTVYYIRLHYRDGHSDYAVFYMPRCTGQGAYTGRLCNETCSSNHDCHANLACYSGRCRLPSNPNSEICANPPDQGLNRSCNEYCADTSECAAGYECWWNRCRNPENLEDIYCREPATSNVIYQTRYLDYVIAGSCNSSCTYDSECAYALECINNQCRHPSNPDNDECLALSKGSSTEDEEASPTAEVTLDLSPSPEITHKPISTGVETEEELIAEQTALEALKEYLEDRGISTNVLLTTGAVGLFFLLLLLFLLSRKGKAKAIDPNKIKKAQPLTGTRPSQSTQRPPSSTGQKIGVGMGARSQVKTSATPEQAGPITRPQAQQTKSIPGGTPPAQPGQSTASNMPGGDGASSMMERMKSKGVKPPQG